VSRNSATRLLSGRRRKRAIATRGLRRCLWKRQRPYALRNAGTFRVRRPFNRRARPIAPGVPAYDGRPFCAPRIADRALFNTRSKTGGALPSAASLSQRCFQRLSRCSLTRPCGRPIIEEKRTFPFTRRLPELSQAIRPTS